MQFVIFSLDRYQIVLTGRLVGHQVGHHRIHRFRRQIYELDSARAGNDPGQLFLIKEIALFDDGDDTLPGLFVLTDHRLKSLLVENESYETATERSLER